MDILDRCRTFTDARMAMQAGVYPYFLPFEDADAAVAHLDGREIIMCGSNNYLGLTRDPRVVAAAQEAVARYGTSCTGSRLLNGNLRLHEELEAELADYFGKQAALVFPTGYSANLGALSALAGSDDTILLDREVHASLLDATGLTRATARSFRHNDIDDLRRRLAQVPAESGCLVVVDGVYSMAGDICPLPDVIDVVRRHGARLLVDDAHGAGVLGGGRGTCAHFGATDDVDVITITFSKAFASIGGAVLGDADVIHYLRHHARSEIFSASMTPASTAAALAAVRIVREEPWRALLAVQHAATVSEQLRALGYRTHPTSTAILPVPMAAPMATAFAWRRLLDIGVYANAVVPPAASPRLRTSFTAAHTNDHLTQVVAAFAQLRDEGYLEASSGAVTDLARSA